MRTYPYGAPLPQDFGFAMVKPDGVELGISDDVTSRIESAGLCIDRRKLSVIEPAQVDAIYPDLVTRPFYPAMKESIVGRRALSLIVVGEHSVSETLMAIKGSIFDVSGTVRGDYSLAHSLPDEYRELYMAGLLTEAMLLDAGFGHVIRDDRMHCDENTVEATQSIKAIFPS